MQASDLDELFQSAYKNKHSTETVLLRVKNGIELALNDNDAVFLGLPLGKTLWLHAVYQTDFENFGPIKKNLRHDPFLYHFFFTKTFVILIPDANL